MTKNYLNLFGDPKEAEERYHQLKDKGQKQDRKDTSFPSNPDSIPKNQIIFQETLPGGSYWHGVIKKGRTLRFINTQKTKGLSLQIFNAQDVSERYCAGDTVKVQWSAKLSQGNVLLSAMGRVLATITDDRCTAHDSIVGHSTAASNEKKYGTEDYFRNSQDAFTLAAMKYNMTVRDIHPSLTLFAPIKTTKDGNFVWNDSELEAGQFVDLRAEMDLIILASNCPHPLAPGSTYDPKPIDILVWHPEDTGSNDVFHSATEEAQRAFENTADYHLLGSYNVAGE